jgi:hypothetical protein
LAALTWILFRLEQVFSLLSTSEQFVERLAFWGVAAFSGLFSFASSDTSA